MPFTGASLRFLRGLARNNAKPWFEAHRSDYENHVRTPMQQLIEEMDVRFARFAPEFTGDPKRSMFRIHRDTRFSHDKSPYKGHAACWFRHRHADHKVGGEAEGGGAGFYFHLQPGASFVGGGIWRPPRGLLNNLRDGIADDPAGFETIVMHPAFRRRFGGLDGGDVLKRMPRGFADDHPAAEWLRYKSFTVGRRVTDTQVTGGRLPGLIERDFAAMLPLVRWLNGCLGLGAGGRARGF
ncbi:MAG TPA: DUF2461 domain-containing protein [Gemmatimonadales bacterium]